MAIFITGTDTSIGKTLISSWICLHTKASYWKPIQTGSEDETDTKLVSTLANAHTHPEAYLLKKSLSPYAAAKMERKKINPKIIFLPRLKNLIVEGAGGVLVPIAFDYCMTDLIEDLKLPVIVVARSSLGTINHTCLTIEALRRRKIKILGVIMNGEPNSSNKRLIEEFGKTKVLAQLPPLAKINKETLKTIRLPALLKKVLKTHL